MLDSVGRSEVGDIEADAGSRPWAPQSVMFGGLVGVAGLGGWFVGLAYARSAHEWLADAELLRLFQFMAVIKLGMAGMAIALIGWRLRRPITAGYAALLMIAGAAMAASPGMIWHGVGIVPAALLFHAGLLTVLLVGLVDRDTRHWTHARRFAGSRPLAQLRR